MVLINFAGKEREIRFDFNAICAMEEIAGKPLQEIMSKGNTGFNTIRMMLWAGLRHENKMMTMDRVGEMIQGLLESGEKLEDVMIKVMEALEKSGIINAFEEKEGTDEGGIIAPQTGDWVKNTEEHAYFLGLKPSEFFIMTPSEFKKYSESQIKRFDIDNKNADRRSALIASILANANRDTKKKRKPFTIDDFMPKIKKDKKPMDANIMAEVLKAICVANGGEVA